MIALGADHGGYFLKEEIKKHLEERGIEYKDFGTYTPESIDYAAIAYRTCKAVTSGECEKAILCCGTGIGISMAANKVKGIRAAVCSEPYSAALTRRHNDANIIAFGARVVGIGEAEAIVDAFFGAEFEGGRHQARVDMLMDIEKQQ